MACACVCGWNGVYWFARFSRGNILLPLNRPRRTHTRKHMHNNNKNNKNNNNNLKHKRTSQKKQHKHTGSFLFLSFPFHSTSSTMASSSSCRVEGCPCFSNFHFPFIPATKLSKPGSAPGDTVRERR